MALSKRKEKPTPEGRKGSIPAGGRVGRAPGMGNTKGRNTGTGGAGRDHPTQGFGQSRFRRFPKVIPPTKPKPEDENG